MKSIIVITLALVALVSGVTITKNVRYADNKLLEKQQKILEVLQHVHQQEVHTRLFDDAKNYKLLDNIDNYTNVKAVREFIQLYKSGMLNFDDIFTVLNDDHREQVVALFHLFYYAKDWDTFYRTIVWARFHVNEGMFIYALHAATLHRKDMVGVVLPAIYEIYPHYFFTSDVIQKAQNVKMQGFFGAKKVEDVNNVIIKHQYTGEYIHTNRDQKVSYFTEDIGLNSYYYYFHMDYPFWLGGNEHGLNKDRRGENFLYTHQQLLARYYLERLSNGLGEIKDFSWRRLIRTGYYSNLRYYNGVHFPTRDNHHILYNDETYSDIERIEEYERRFVKAIDRGYFLTPEGTRIELSRPETVDILGNLIQGNFDSKNRRFYRNFIRLAKIVLGTSVDLLDDNRVIPSVLEHYETAMRDPVFYQLYKKVINLYWQFKDLLPRYTVDELIFKGVRIENIEVDKLITYFDTFDADISNAVDVEVHDEETIKSSVYNKLGRITHHQGNDFVVKARQQRLNHIPFTVKLNVLSERATRGIVRLYLGPKFDEFGNIYGINENRENFVLLDAFTTDLVSGKNLITRDSQLFHRYVRDRTTFFDLYKIVMSVNKGDNRFKLDQTEAHCGFPSRLMLPRGRKGGMLFQIYAIISPIHEPTIKYHEGYDSDISCGVGTGARYLDSLPLGYPFDRRINEVDWFTPNMQYLDVNIFHKHENEINNKY